MPPHRLRTTPWLLPCVVAALACQPASRPVPQPVARAAYAIAGDDTLELHRFAAAHPHAASDAAGRTGAQTRDLRPAVLLLHGGGWTGGTPTTVYEAAAAFADSGFAAFAVEYRRSDSTRTPLESIADVCAALRWTRLHADSLGIDSTRVALYGVSAGGHLAASTVTVGCPETLWDRGADALLLLSPAVDVADDEELTALLHGRATARDVSPVANPRAALPPTVIIQGAADPYTTLAGAQRFCLLVVAQRQTCDLRVYDGLGHVLGRNLRDDGQPFDPDPLARADALQHQVRFLQRLWSDSARRAP